VVGCHISVRDCWCNSFALKVHAPSEDESDYSTDRFYKGLKKIIRHFRKYN
jgi:hypothetical protein